MSLQPLRQPACETTVKRTYAVIRATASFAVTPVAGIAATISFAHIRDLALAHGQSPVDAKLLPLSIDG
jgi:hypothetical protein